jgi:hypothetical protein
VGTFFAVRKFLMSVVSVTSIRLSSKKNCCLFDA